VLLADTLAGASIAHLYVGEYDRSITLSERALELSRSTRDVWGQSYSRLAVAEAFRQRGEYGRAVEVAEESIRLGELATFISAQTHTRARLALVYADLGAVDRALELVEIALEVAGARKYIVDTPFMVGTLARVQVMSGRLADAVRTIEDARADPHAEVWVVLHFPVWMAEVELALQHQQFDRAARAADDLIGYLRQYGTRSHLPKALYLKAQALLGLRQEAAARDHLLEARAEAETMGARRILWRILDALSRLETDPAQAKELQTEARQVIRYIVAQIDQDDLRASFLSLPEVRAAILEVE
jgi:tetratricopeptide (TPR) repeat protein